MSYTISTVQHRGGRRVSSLISPSVNVNRLDESWESLLCTICAGPLHTWRCRLLSSSHTLALCYMMLWTATSRHRNNLCHPILNIWPLLQPHRWSHGTWTARNWVHGLICGETLLFRQSLSSFFVPSPTSPLLISCEFQHTIYTSTLRNPSASTRRVLQ